MIPNPYEAPRSTSDDELERLLVARRIRWFLVLTGLLVALYFIYDSLASQLFDLDRSKAIRELKKLEN